MNHNVRASHDRNRLQHETPGAACNEVMMDDVYVSLGGFCIISLRDAHGIASAFSEALLDVYRGYDHFIKATVNATLEVNDD